MLDELPQVIHDHLGMQIHVPGEPPITRPNGHAEESHLNCDCFDALDSSGVLYFMTIYVDPNISVNQRLLSPTEQYAYTHGCWVTPSYRMLRNRVRELIVAAEHPDDVEPITRRIMSDMTARTEAIRASVPRAPFESTRLWHNVYVDYNTSTWLGLGDLPVLGWDNAQFGVLHNERIPVHISPTARRRRAQIGIITNPHSLPSLSTMIDFYVSGRNSVPVLDYRNQPIVDHYVIDLTDIPHHKESCELCQEALGFGEINIDSQIEDARAQLVNEIRLEAF